MIPSTQNGNPGKFIYTRRNLNLVEFDASGKPVLHTLLTGVGADVVYKL
ncbi:MAG: hypothetical protein ACRER2_06155 [Methylococcales bacterium]